MKKLYFFCDSQANILSAYFMLKIYFDTNEYESILLVSDNSSKSVTCAERAKQLNIWKRVEIVNESFKNEKELEDIANTYKIQAGDILGVFSLKNRFARIMYRKAYQFNNRIMVIDEGVNLLKEFIEWQKDNPNNIFVDVEKYTIEAWCYEPAMFELPSNINIHRIELKENIEEVEKCSKLQQEVETLFNIQKEKNYQIIYFDQYYSLNGRTISLIEKYILKKVENICKKYNFAIKPHPMERGFETKYDEISTPIMNSQDAPWEAIYFVNYYKKSEQKVVAISGDSMAIVTPLLMYGDNNYEIVLMKNIHDCYFKNIIWGAREFYEKLADYLKKNNREIYMPNNFVELESIITSLMDENGKMNASNSVEDKVIQELSRRILKYEPSILLCTLIVYDEKGENIADLKKEYVIDGEVFKISYDISKVKKASKLSCRWIPCGRCYLAMKDIEIIGKNEQTENIITTDLLYEQGKENVEDGFCENISAYPSFRFECSSEYKTIIIRGKWKFEFSKDRLVNKLEEQVGLLQADKEKQLIEYNKKIQHFDDLCKQLQEENTKLQQEKEKIVYEKETQIQHYKENYERLKNEKEEFSESLCGKMYYRLKKKH